MFSLWARIVKPKARKLPSRYRRLILAKVRRRIMDAGPCRRFAARPIPFFDNVRDWGEFPKGYFTHLKLYHRSVSFVCSRLHFFHAICRGPSRDAPRTLTSKRAGHLISNHYFSSVNEQPFVTRYPRCEYFLNNNLTPSIVRPRA